MTSELFVWAWLPGAVEPIVCGRLESTGDRLEFVYGRSFRSRERAIPLMPERMPLDGGPFSARRNGQLPGPIADAAPDVWGRRVIEYRERSGGFGELDYLLRSHGDRIGALHFQESATDYTASTVADATLAQLLAAAEALERNQSWTFRVTAQRSHCHHRRGRNNRRGTLARRVHRLRRTRAADRPT